jgi:hypothetical protein
MDTESARELLPWLLNGSLEESERDEVLNALRASEELRRELAETRLGGEVFGQHVPAADLVAHAFGEPAGLDRGRIDAHVALCERCAEELAMVRESRELAGTPEPGAEERRRGRLLSFLRPSEGAYGGVAAGWQAAALAATLVALVGLGGWTWTWQQSQERVGELVASLREAIPPAAGPDAGAIGLISDVLRSAGDGCDGPNCLALHARTGRATLYLQVETAPEEIYELRLNRREDDGREPLRLQPVAATPGGQLEFRPPANLLEAGQYDAELVRLGDRGWERVESYPLTVVYERR